MNEHLPPVETVESKADEKLVRLFERRCDVLR